jgi:enoyl-CoA hydratase
MNAPLLLDEPLLYEKLGATVVITLNRPQKLNALNSPMRNALINAWNKFEEDDSARVAILTGAGQRAFCAGRDLTEGTADRQEDFLPMIGDNVKVSKPVIAAVNGLAFGAGWFMVQGCDLCVASDEASFALPEAKVGRGPAWAAWLHGMLPQKVALELLMTGNAITAHRAHEIGLVNHVVPAAEVLPCALALAADIVAAAPLSVSVSRQIVYDTMGLSRKDALQEAFRLCEPIYQSADALEGVNAFRQKRSPVWTGR